MEKYTPVTFQSVELKHGFWHERQNINRDKTISAIRDRFMETGRFDAFRFGWKPGMPNKPHIFWDSDIAKWIEAVAYISEKGREPALEAEVDAVVELIEEHQEESGYFNIYFTVVEPENRFKKRTEHELYCAGHLMEAAVAYFEATGKDKFLKLMCRYADHIEKVFRINRSAAFVTPGHEEIELALVKLWRCTGEQRYLELSKFFIDSRGQDDPSCYYPGVNARYAQDHLPVRQQTTAEGHSVRACYLYSGMADIAREYGDGELFEACRTIFENIAYRRMYVTGGIGSSHHGEAFTIDYDLPNATAYAETCAAISLALFARRMLLLDADSLYGDVAERALYNGFLSGISLDGKSFFYENPLEIDPALHGRDASKEEPDVTRFPITQRKECFDCSCCPPNVARLIASIGDFLYTHDEKTLFIHHYMDSNASFEMGDGQVTVRQATRYPADGEITLTVSGLRGMDIAVRIPSWCRSYRITADGQPVPYAVRKGYAYIPCNSDEMTLMLQFDMEVRLLEASPLVQEDAGRVALQRGPLVYCLEAVDNGPCLRDVLVDADMRATLYEDAKLGAVCIETQGWRRDPAKITELYQPLSDTYVPAALRFIPYYAFANRGESEMLVWVGYRR